MNRHEHKIRQDHRARPALVYVRQSTEKQVKTNLESQRLQYGLVERARSLGWGEVEVVDEDLGTSAGPASNRPGFERVLARVARGQVGIIFCLEVSRLSRNDPDWAKLLQICGLFDTLIGDADNLYDLSSADDQMVLGIKGTLSVMEWTSIKLRMMRGTEEKARRGELRKTLPAGFIYDPDGNVVKDPDQRVQDAIHLVFQKFRELWSVRQTFKWFHDEGLEIPVTRGGKGRWEVVWELPNLSRVACILQNPVYAGAYAHGKRQQRVVFENGQVVKRTGGFLPMDQWKVLIKDHHESYISWEVHEDNLRKIRSNALQLGGGDERVGPVRAGQGLLVGLLRCGHCGRRLHIRYQGKSGTHGRYMCIGEYAAGGAYCIAFGGTTVDRKLGAEIIGVLEPIGLEASLKATERIGAEHDERRWALEKQLEQLRYEARRAFEQYDEVDPRNRLVAAELERRWNAKLEEVERLQQELSSMKTGRRVLSEEEGVRILALGNNFHRTWDSPGCPPELKKKILRTLLEEIVVRLDDETQELRFVLHWKGGAHTEFAMDKPKSAAVRRTDLEVREIVAKMAGFYEDGEIAQVLNRLGRRTATGLRWSSQRVATIRRRYKITPREDGHERGVSVLTMAQAALYCGVSTISLRKLAASGLFPHQQAAPGAPWEIRKEDLDAQPVQTAIQHLRATGRLPKPDSGEGTPSDQLGLFAS